MQYLSTLAALVATTAALDFATLDYSNPINIGTAKVVNRCSYPVYLWSVDKELGCPAEAATKLDTGASWSEKFKNGTNGGISVKLSKSDTCGGKDITQLEYKLSYESGYVGNYLDMSFVDCTGNLEDCPGRTDGFYLKSGNKIPGVSVSSVNNEHCPIFNVHNAEDAVKVAYINWDDPQTKFCNIPEDLSLYLCGGEAPDSDDDSSDVPTPSAASSSAAPSSTAPSSSSEIESSSAPSPTSQEQKPTSSAPAAPSSTEAEFVVAAAAVTPAPAAPAAPAIKTEVVYVTQYVDRRHVHAHGRRHQHFRA